MPEEDAATFFHDERSTGLEFEGGTVVNHDAAAGQHTEGRAFFDGENGGVDEILFGGDEVAIGRAASV